MTSPRASATANSQIPRDEGVSLQHQEKGQAMSAPTGTGKAKAMIQDNTRCIGCRACMVACKSWNDRPADHTEVFAGEGYQNPATSTPTTTR
jgi:NAD-dependent dihydropyrimidine dehydrogenase PreA subunit